MQVSERFLALLEQQLAQFTDRPDLRALVVYVALPEPGGQPSLMAIGHWPANLALSGSNALSATTSPEEGRRWLALRDGERVLGALRVDADRWPWPDSLSQRLEATARCLTEALRLDLEHQRLGRELARRDDQLKLLVHQLRNPLAALRTFSQLLRRRLDGDGPNRDLVDNLIGEQRQINRYVEAIDALAATPALPPAPEGPQPLLLPPALGGPDPQCLSAVLAPLLERAAGTAALQGRHWHPPSALPERAVEAGALTEILANLLENAFRYSRSGGAVGLLCQGGLNAEQGLALSVWDSGPPIPHAERERIFSRGERGSRGAPLPGSGLGLALARDLARSLGGELDLIVPAAQLNPGDALLPAEGNAFRLRLPAPAPSTPSAAGSS
jgi:signal transduction histidine kinase